MLIFFGHFVLLLFNTVFAESECGSTYNNKSILIVYSKQYETKERNSCDFYIIANTNVYVGLNFTDLRGFEIPLEPENTSTSSMECLPKIIITERDSSGEEILMGIICPVKKLFKTPQVFLSHANNLTLIYKWDPQQRSGFTLYIDFHLKVNACTFYCDDSSCLSDKLLVCNGKSDCVDQSDEQNCNEREDTSPAPTEQPLRSNSNIMPIIVIIIIVVCILGVIIFGLCHCHISSWMCQGDDSRNRTPEHENLHPSSQTNFSEDLSGIPAQEQRAIAQFKEKQTRLKSIRTDMELGLPPSIPISEDGEEGYVTSQRLLQSCERSHKADCQAFCPPPNRTIRNGESPSSLCHAHSTPNSSFLGLSTHKQATLPTVRLIRDSNGHPTINSYSYLEGNSHPPRSKSHTRTSSSSTLQTNINNPASQNPQKFDQLGNYSLLSSAREGRGGGNRYSFQSGRNV